MGNKYDYLIVGAGLFGATCVRLGMYKYFDMDDTIGAAFKLIERLIGEKKV